MANIIKFTEAERILLEVNEKHKFKLSFNDMYKLKEYLNTVGELTSFYFDIQADFFKNSQDLKKLEEFNNRISKEELNIDFDFDKLSLFVNKIVNEIKDKELYNLLDSFNG